MEREYKRCLQRLVVSAALLAAGPVLAQMSPVAQHREISARASGESMECGSHSHLNSEQAPGLGAWDADVSAGVCGLSAGASQSSGMTSCEIRLETSGWIICDGGLPSMTYYSGSFESEFSFEFRVIRTMGYTWSGSMGMPLPGEGGLTPGVQLAGPGGLVYQHYSEETSSFTTSGELEPGLYTVTAAIGAESSGSNTQGGPPAQASIEFLFDAMPPACPCDWSGDQAVNSDDFFMFLNDFFGGEADFNFDGVTNSQDFFDFLGCFFAPPGGCA